MRILIDITDTPHGANIASMARALRGQGLPDTTVERILVRRLLGQERPDGTFEDGILDGYSDLEVAPGAVTLTAA